MTEKEAGSRESLRIPWSSDGQLPGHLSPSAGTASPLERNVPPRRALQGAEAPRPGQGAALAPREPRGGGGGKEVQKDGVAAGVAGGRQGGGAGAGMPRGGVERDVPQSVGQ